MPVAASHFFGLMAHELIYDPLVYSRCSQIGSKGVPKNMKACDEGPLAHLRCLLEMMLCLPQGQRRNAAKPSELTERLLATWVLFHPVLQDFV